MATSADRVNKKMGREGEGRGGEERAGKGQEGKEGRKKEEREGGGRKTNFTWSFYQHRISYKKKNQHLDKSVNDFKDYTQK